MADTTQQSHIDDRWDSFAMEPVPDFVGDYCHTHQTDCGHIKMMSDTPDNEFILTQHADGSYEMYLPNGKVQKDTEGDHIHMIVKNNKVWIKGSSLIHVDGHANINVGKNAYIGVKGDMDFHVDGNATLTSQKTLTLQGDNVNIVAKKEVSTSTKEFSFPDTTIRGDLHVNGTIHSLGDIHTTSTVFSQLGFLSPGSLIIGPLASPGSPIPNLTMATNFVTIQCLMPILINTAVEMNIGSGAAMQIEAGAVIDVAAGGAITIDAGAAMELAAGGLMDIAAAGAVGIQGTSVSIEPDLAVGYLLSILGHIHGNGNMGTPTTPPIPGT